MILFGKKEEKKIGKGFVPIERVKEMLDKGFTEIEIIDTLRKEGFSAEEIDKALTEAYKDIVSKPLTQLAPPESPQTPQPPNLQPQLQTQQTGTNVQLPQLQQTHSLQPQQQALISEHFEAPEISVEEYLDSLIRSKMEELSKRLIEISLRQKDLEEKIVDLESKLTTMEKGRRDELEKILLEIRGNKESINDLVIRVESLSKTIKELLPTLVEAVRLLSEIVQKTK